MALDVRTSPGAQVAPAGALGAQRARYLPIAEHGLIGDLHTSALVGTDGDPQGWSRQADALAAAGAAVFASNSAATRYTLDLLGANS